MAKNLKDRTGNPLKVGDKVHNKWGYDLIICYDDQRQEFYGKLICEPGDSCEDIPYAICEEELTKIN